MPLEGGAYIHNLNELWPLSSDPVSQGDDHLRLLKKALWGDGGLSTDGTFRLFTGPIELSSDEINALPTDISNVQTDVDAQVTELLKHVVPKGVIEMWSGTVATIPTGWELCDGTLDANSDPKPDLTDKFIIGAGSTYTPGDNADGTGSTGAAGQHDHGGTTGGATLTVEQLPDLSTLQFEIRSDYVANNQGDAHFEEGWVAGGRDVATSWTTQPLRFQGQTGGGGESHDHTITQEPDHTHTQELPPYYALAFIIKVSEYEDPSP